ncbi:MAG: FAD:protein FMN transferase [Alphaproteobacteria bacterium]|nr:FAD:protein FMN transferase [Alphaproteobacteria bacterium]
MHPDRELAARAFAAAEAEIERLENEFSLFRVDSALARLNRSGRLDHPGLDMRRLLAEALRFAAITGGTFDPTVQPLWDLHAAHFARDPGDARGPSPEAIAAARLTVGWRRIGLSESAVTLPPGTRMTLNGIAQGYITDRVAELLRGLGFARVLLDLGEARGLGGPWTAEAREFSSGPIPFRLPLNDSALAVSAPGGTVFEPSGRWHHLFDPATGRPARSWRAVAVRAADATTADALSTALAVAAEEKAAAIVRAAGGTEAWLMDENKNIHHITA